MAFIGIGMPSDAQVRMKRVKALSDDNVSRFIQETTAMTSINNVDRDEAQMRGYLDRHIDPKARFKTSITYSLPGIPSQARVLTLSKADYIEQVQQGAGSVDHYHSEIDIKDIQIAKNKKSASVSTVATETGIMQVPQEDGSVEDIPIEGTTECFQVLKIGKQGYIQMYSANCKTEMAFQSY